MLAARGTRGRPVKAYETIRYDMTWNDPLCYATATTTTTTNNGNGTTTTTNNKKHYDII